MLSLFSLFVMDIVVDVLQFCCVDFVFTFIVFTCVKLFYLSKFSYLYIKQLRLCLNVQSDSIL